VDTLSKSKDYKPAMRQLLNMATHEACLFYHYNDKKALYFTDRECEIIRYISKGHTSKEISDILFISCKTTNTHRQNIMNKANLSNTSHLISLAHFMGLV
jgi:DNA-binding CsgD family transcriptional regulator